jgi:hypothetical protein
MLLEGGGIEGEAVGDWDGAARSQLSNAEPIFFFFMFALDVN